MGHLVLTITEFKTVFQKRELKLIKYRDYKNFDNNKFRSEILKRNFNYTDLRTFKETVFNIFNKYATIKRKYVRANEAPFTTKELHKAIMKRSRLINKFLKDGTENNQKNFKHQRNFCKKLLKTTKKSCYSNLDIKIVTDNKTFWKTITLIFTKRPLKGEKINLIENGKNISNDTNYVISSMVFYSRNPKAVRYGTETVSYIAPKIWSKVPETTKMSSSLESFKTKIDKWKPECDCRLCTTFLHHVGFVNVI